MVSSVHTYSEHHSITRTPSSDPGSCDYSAQNPRNHATSDARKQRDPVENGNHTESKDKGRSKEDGFDARPGMLDRVIEGRVM